MHLDIHVHPAFVGLIQFQKLVGNEENLLATVYGREFFHQELVIICL